jgi:heme oxygenase
MAERRRRGSVAALPYAAGMPPPSPSSAPRVGAAHARLRSATAHLHAGVDDLFANGLDSVPRYRRYVLGMHRFAAEYEIAVAAAPRHSAWLAGDLASLSLSPLPPEGERRPASGAAARLGWRYVMAGSSMGARRLLRDARQLGYDDSSGATFLAQHAASDEWGRLRDRLQAMDADDETRMAEAETGACAAFALVRSCFARSFERIPATPAHEPCR